ncbi:cyclic lactone autoinducer peptide [Carnobacterium divergens]|nr:cyclic lactone autoinducer peptide [Carnobacterium divergens]MDT1996661.1 cyclic lactone autoinducer peptide [Carnobacterium divergens]TFI62029.1 cyclic lactone autoinducer peptide [Carnobacterium divergens]TFI62063.1 cyclic lactone autoinducer peptide [Carnobacterium divergens]TFI69551.1 cyclic lactone autoinducer peptide [Carnobacterium divergens]TFI77776.1 cyclic lactone autoinducer peptide [Carnobacterium divergens]
MEEIKKILKEGITKLFIGLGGFSVENCCFGFAFEPEIPEELKK